MMLKGVKPLEDSNQGLPICKQFLNHQAMSRWHLRYKTPYWTNTYPGNTKNVMTLNGLEPRTSKSQAFALPSRHVWVMHAPQNGTFQQYTPRQ